jgi:hypothetical protein
MDIGSNWSKSNNPQFLELDNLALVEFEPQSNLEPLRVP